MQRSHTGCTAVSERLVLRPWDSLLSSCYERSAFALQETKTALSPYFAVRAPFAAASCSFLQEPFCSCLSDVSACCLALLRRPLLRQRAPAFAFVLQIFRLFGEAFLAATSAVHRAMAFAAVLAFSLSLGIHFAVGFCSVLPEVLYSCLWDVPSCSAGLFASVFLVSVYIIAAILAVVNSFFYTF